jgi:protein-S-isoprenylcysteine O-methyltransferase Ste14
MLGAQGDRRIGGRLSAWGSHSRELNPDVSAGAAAACASALLVISTSLAVAATPVLALAFYASLVAVASGVEATLAPRAERPSALSPPAQWLAQASSLILLAVWLGSPLLARQPPRTWHVALGSVVLLSGAALRAAAIARLGARFNSDNHIEASASLEIRGLYRCLAHPSELGLLLLVLGAAMFWGADTMWSIPLLYLLALARLNVEEAALVRHHGVRYAIYRRTTLDPFPILTPQGGASA